MKKIFTLFVALFAFAFCVKAQQVTIILEAHDVWGDGSGYQLLLDADHTAYGTVIPQTGGLTTSGDADASTYAQFEYKIPTNADGSLSTTNIVFDGQETITIPAGTYDWCVTNPTPGDRMWIAGEGRADDYVFDPAFIYHFTVAREGSGDQVTITMIPAGDDPVIMANAEDVAISSILGSQAEATVEVSGYNLTTGITVTTYAPFSVSSTGTNYGTTATLNQDGGTLYIQYNPTTAGTDNGIITLSSTGATSVNITLIGTAIDCGNTPLPYSNDFTDEGLNQCWTIDDYNGDAKTWSFNTSGGYAIYSYNSNEAADDWLISPVFHIGANAAASFDYMCASASYPEKFEVYVIGAGQTYDDATLVVPEVQVTVTSWTTQDIDLTAFANQHIQIAIRCTSDADEYLLGVTNFFIDSDPVSISNVEKSSVNVYPNPANNYINVNASSNISNVEVYTISGQKVGDFTANGTQTVISTANLSNGMYLMRINTENGVINNKFSVVR
jgi:gingipain R/gingipain K